MTEGTQTEGQTLYGNDFVYHTSKLWESKSTSELDKAMVKFSAKFKAVKRDEVVAVTSTKNRKFASLDEIMIEIRPILAEFGLYVQQPICGDEILTFVRHESGEFRACSMPMVAWKGNNTTPIQDLGGAITYLRRYSLGAMLALATEEDDDAASTGKIQPGKVQEPTRPPQPSNKPKPEPPPELTDKQKTMVDEWNSQVDLCKKPEDFQKLSDQIAEIKDGAVLIHIRLAMGKQMEQQKVLWTKGTGFHEAETKN